MESILSVGVTTVDAIDMVLLGKLLWLPLRCLPTTVAFDGVVLIAEDGLAGESSTAVALESFDIRCLLGMTRPLIVWL
jgi:hypothetical protein